MCVKVHAALLCAHLNRKMAIYTRCALEMDPGISIIISDDEEELGAIMTSTTNGNASLRPESSPIQMSGKSVVVM